MGSTDWCHLQTCLLQVCKNTELVNQLWHRTHCFHSKTSSVEKAVPWFLSWSNPCLITGHMLSSTGVMCLCKNACTVSVQLEELRQRKSPHAPSTKVKKQNQPTRITQSLPTPQGSPPAWFHFDTQCFTHLPAQGLLGAHTHTHRSLGDTSTDKYIHKRGEVTLESSHHVP